jgi:Skp family chaperone for outer membrane proteins
VRRNILVVALVCAGLTFSFWGVSAAQNQNNRQAAPAGAEARVALVDVAYIFKNYDKFTRLYENMKSEVKQREKEIADAQSDLKILMNKKQSLTPDSPDYKRVEQQIVQKKGQLELDAESARREFTQKEASLYHQTYQEVENQIKLFAQRNNITLVLRASSDNDSGTANPQDVIKEVSQMVIYSLPEMDITQPILTALNGPATKVSGPSSSGGKGTTTPPKGSNPPPPTVGGTKDSNKPQTGGNPIRK